MNLINTAAHFPLSFYTITNVSLEPMIKASVGHAEGASGQVGLLTLQHLLCSAVALGNAKLAVPNPLVAERLTTRYGRVAFTVAASNASAGGYSVAANVTLPGEFGG